MGTRGRADPAQPALGTAGLVAAPERTASGRGTGGMGRADRRKIARRAARRRKRSFLRELPVIAIVALLIALLLKTFLLQVFVIPSGSMENTINVGDRVLVDKLTPWFGTHPERGDVVVFKDPGGWLEPGESSSADGPVVRKVKETFSSIGLLPSESEQDLIKRVIGVGGDTVACCDAQGRVTVNGIPVDEPYLFAGNVPSQTPFTVVVPQGRLWVMGDHREISADSRFHMNDVGQGTIPLSNVIGRAFVVAWPIGRMHMLPEPEELSKLPAPPGTVIKAEGAPGDSAVPGQSIIAGPVPQEPPLVMGVLGVFPFLTGRRRRYHDRN